MNLRDLLTQLVAINSVNPALVPGAPGERAITEFVAAWLAARSVRVAEIPSGYAEGDRPSLLCHVAGTGTGRSLLLYAHTDTVGVAGMTSPFAATVRGGALHGRGAWDMKGSLAVILRLRPELPRGLAPVTSG
jgi:acetylornithine deacetylase